MTIRPAFVHNPVVGTITLEIPVSVYRHGLRVCVVMTRHGQLICLECRPAHTGRAQLLALHRAHRQLRAFLPSLHDHDVQALTKQALTYIDDLIMQLS